MWMHETQNNSNRHHSIFVSQFIIFHVFDTCIYKVPDKFSQFTSWGKIGRSWKWWTIWYLPTVSIILAEKELFEELSPQKNSCLRIHHSKHHNVELSEKRTVDPALCWPIRGYCSQNADTCSPRCCWR